MRNGSVPGDSEGGSNVVLPRIVTGAVAAIAERAGAYLAAGYGLHLHGPVGTGKTTLAALIAEGRTGQVLTLAGAPDPPAMLLAACLSGATLLADGASAELAAIGPRLAAVLSDGTLPLAVGGSEGRPVAAGFRALVVTGPGEQLPAALSDRLIPISCDGPDRDTEIAIAASRSGLTPDEAGRIVDMVRDIRRSREYAERPSLRCTIALCRLAHALGCSVSADDARFVALVLDMLGARLRHTPDGLPDPRHRQMLAGLVGHFCSDRPRAQAVAA